MRRSTLLFLAMTACGPTAVDETIKTANKAQDDDIAHLRAENATLTENLDAATQAIDDLTSRLDALEAHERLIAAEVIDDGQDPDGVAADVPGLVAQLESSRIDSLGAPELAVLTARVVANEAALTALTDHERALAAEVTGVVPVASVLTDFEGQLFGSEIDQRVTTADLDQRAYATIVYVDAQDDLEHDWVVADYATNATVAAADSAERQWVVDQGYLTAGLLVGYATQAWVTSEGFATVGYVSAGDAAERQWVVDQGYATIADLDAYATDADLTSLAGRVSTIEGDYLQAGDLAPYATQTWVATNYPEQAELDAVEADLADALLTLGDHEARLAALEADPITAAEVAAADDGVVALVEDLVGDLSDAIAADYLTSDVVIPVADCDALITELNALDRRRFAAGVTVELNVAVGDHACPDAIVMHHPQGDQISITGDLDHPEMVRLNFAGSGVLAPDGHHLGLIDGMTLAGQGAYGSYGLGAWFGGSFNAGSHVVVQDFYRGVGAHSGGAFFARGVAVTGCTDGFYVDGAFGDAMEGAVVGGLSNGFYAEHGGVLIAANAATQDVVGAGFIANSNSYLDAQGSDVLRSSGGFVARNGAVVFAENATATSVDFGVEAHIGSTTIATGLVVTDSTGYGMVARYGSTLIAADATVSGAGGDAFLANWGSVVATARSNSTNVGRSGLVLAMGSVADGTGMTVNQSVLSGAKVFTGSVAELYGSHVSSSAAYGFEVDSGSYAVITAADQSDFGGNGAGFFNETPNVAGNRNSWIER